MFSVLQFPSGESFSLFGAGWLLCLVIHGAASKVAPVDLNLSVQQTDGLVFERVCLPFVSPFKALDLVVGGYPWGCFDRVG